MAAVTVYTLQEQIDELARIVECTSKTLHIVRRQLQDHIADHEAFDIVLEEDSND